MTGATAISRRAPQLPLRTHGAAQARWVVGQCLLRHRLRVRLLCRRRQAGHLHGAGRRHCGYPRVCRRRHQLTTGSLQLESVATDTATATVLSVAIGLAAGTGGDANASVDSDVQSWIGTLTGTSTTTVTATGAVQVVATASQSATGSNQGGSGGALTVSWLNATTSVSSAITALIGDGVTISSAGTVQLRAETFNADATSNVTVGGGGGGEIAGVTVTAISNPTITAAVGDGVQIGSASPVAGDVSITALGRAAADATGNAYAGGLVVVATPQATVTIDPAVDVHVGTAAV